MTANPPEDWVSALQSQTLRFLTDAIPGPVSYLDREFRYRFVNSAYRAFLTRVKSELDPDSIIGRTPTEAYGVEMGEALLPNLRRALAGERFTIEVGLPISRTLNSYIPHIIDGEVVGVLLVAQDITDLHASRNAVIQSERMATLGRLVSGLLHELNSPIAVVRSTLQTISSGLARATAASVLPDPELRRLNLLRELADAATSATSRVTALTDRLRNFSRIDEARVQCADLHEGIESALFLLAPRCGTDTEIVRQYGEIPRVECEPASINQIFMALLTNAIEAIERTGTITVRTWADGEHAHVEITDTGRGIAKERLTTLFTPSFTAGQQQMKAGVGLYVARNIAEQHRGSLRVTSELGRGATFTLILPL